MNVCIVTRFNNFHSWIIVTVVIKPSSNVCLNCVNTDIVFDNTIFFNNKKTKNGDIGTGIFDVFDRYNFTVVKEDEPLEKEVAVDPEMFGKTYKY